MPSGEKKDLSRLVAGMTLEEKIGQLVMFGFSGREAPEPLAGWLAGGRAGNVIYFSRNIDSPEQLAELSDQLQERAQQSPSGVPLFLATDQEGGSVSRLARGATRLPAAMALGAAGDRELAARTGWVMGVELHACGVNLNLAPVLDVNNNPDNPVIGIRSLSEDPRQVAALGMALIHGMQGAGVAACAKHFPGHGDTATDSHLALPVVSHARARLDAVEFVPFRAAIQAGVAAIMTAHIAFPEIEPETGRPATLSHAVLSELLRREMGFDGPIVTDCLEMNAIKDGVGSTQGALTALSAGADIVLVSHTAALQEETLERLLRAAESGELPAEQIDASVRRVLTAKARFGLQPGEQPPRRDVAAHVGTAMGADVAEEIGRRSVTLLRGAELLPLRSDSADRYMVLEVEAHARSEAEDAPLDRGSLLDVLERRVPGIATWNLPAGHGGNRWQATGDTDQGDESGAAAGDMDDALLGLVRDKELLVIITQSGGGSPAEAEWVSRLVALEGPSVFVVSLRSPYDLRNFPEVDGYLAAYSSTPQQVEAAADVLCGEASAVARLPVRLDV